MDLKVTAPMIGKAGELRVRSELLKRGIGCGVFDFDDGTDIILFNGKKIGVKTTSKPIYDKKSYSWKYTFSIRIPQVRNSGNGMYQKKYMKKDYLNYVDYWIFWCIKDDLFYVIPNGLVGQKISLIIPTPEHLRRYERHKKYISISKYEKFKNNWEQLI